MNLLKLIASILIIASIGACQDKLNITVDGIVTNEISGKPIPNAEVLVHCWYISSFDDGSIDRQTLLTDEHGKFHANFIRGYEVDVAAKQEGYNASKSYIELISNNVFVNLKLSESKEN